MHVECSKQHSDVRSTDIEKPLLYAFSPVKIDAFSYSSHKNWIWIEKNRKSTKKFSLFFTSDHFPYCLLHTFLYRPLWTRKNYQKWFFSDFDLFVWGGCSIDITLEMGPFDPKRHPKSLVSISSTSGGKNPDVTKYPLFGDEVTKLNEFQP